MPPPKEVTSQRVFDDVQFSTLGGSTPVRVLEYTIGNSGPFRHTFQPGEYSPEAANAIMENTVRALRDHGAIP